MIDFINPLPKKTIRLRVIFSATLALLLLASVANFFIELNNILSPTNDNYRFGKILPDFAWSFVSMVFIYLLYITIRGRAEFGSYASFEADVRRKGREEVRRIREEGQKYLSELTNERLHGIVREQITEQALGELIENTDRAVWDKYLDQRIEREIDALRDNLTEWLQSVRRSSLLNYVVALAFAGAGAFTAMTFFLPQYNDTVLRDGTDGNPTITRDILFILVPRALLIVAMELIAFHFFRLHQANEASSRYIRDEINTMRLKTTAFYASLKQGAEDFQREVITNLLGVDRQKVLAVGETTAGLEHQRIGQEGLHQLLEKMTEHLGITKELLSKVSAQENTPKNAKAGGDK